MIFLLMNKLRVEWSPLYVYTVHCTGQVGHERGHFLAVIYCALNYQLFFYVQHIHFSYIILEIPLS